MKNSHLKDSLVAALIAVFAGVSTLGVNVALGEVPAGALPANTNLVAPTFSGLNVKGNISNSDAAVNGGAVKVNDNLDVNGNTKIGGTLDVVGPINSSAYAANPGFIGLRAGGTSANPTAAQQYSTLSSIVGKGYNGSSFASNNPGAMYINAAEDFAPFHYGTNITFFTTPIGTWQPEERVRISDNGNVGIGTTSPSTKLEVNGAIKATGATIGSGTGTVISTAGVLSTVPTVAALWNGAIGGHIYSANTGNVGIGTNNPTAGKVVSVSDATTLPNFVATAPGGAQGQKSGYSFYSTFMGTGDSSPRRTADLIAGFNGGAWGKEFLALNVGGGSDPANPPTEKMRIQADGNVGIGTSNPAAKLDVNGNVNINESLTIGDSNNSIFINKWDIWSPKNPLFLNEYYGQPVQVGSSTGGPTADLNVYGNQTVSGDSTVSGTLKIGTVGSISVLGAFVDAFGKFIFENDANFKSVAQFENIARTMGLLDVRDVIRNDGANNGGYVKIDDKLKVMGQLDVADITNSTNTDPVKIVDPNGLLVGGKVTASTNGAAQGEKSNYSLYSTFVGTTDSAPRRTSDIIAGFNGGAWGNEFLSLNVGNNGAANDASAITSEKIRIQSNGNVGIGTTIPSDKLHVSQSLNGSGGATIENTSTGTSAYSYLKMVNNTNDAAHSAGLLRMGGNNSNYSGKDSLALYTQGDYPIGFITGNALKMIITATGNVGIGTSNPLAALHVVGNEVLDGAIFVQQFSSDITAPSIVGRKARGTSASPTHVLANDNLLALKGVGQMNDSGIRQQGGGGSILIKAAEDFTNAAMGAYIAFNTSKKGTIVDGGSEVMRIADNGNVGIGTTNPGAKLEVNGGAGSSTAINLFGPSANGQSSTLNLMDASNYLRSTWGGNTVLRSYYGINLQAGNSTGGLTINADGTVVTPTSYSTTVTGRQLYIDSTGKIGYNSSSQRFKENIKNLDDVSWLYSLRPVFYNYIEDKTKSKRYGLIAEEVDKINPTVVSRGNDGRIDTVFYEALISPIIKAIQDQKSEIDQLKAENAEIKAALCEIKPSLKLCR